MNIGEEAGNHHSEPVSCDSPCGVLAAGPGAEVLPGHQNLMAAFVRLFAEFRPVQHEIRLRSPVILISPVAEQGIPEEFFILGRGLEETGRNNLVGIHILKRKRHAGALYYVEFLFHCIKVLGSVITPVTAAAAAVSGLASIVLAPGP